MLACGVTVADVLVVSHFQPTTAIALLRYTPPITLLLGAFVNVLPLLATPVLVALIVLGLWDLASDSLRIDRLGYALAVYLAAATLLPPKALPPNRVLAALVVVGFVLVVYRAWARDSEDDHRRLSNVVGSEAANIVVRGVFYTLAVVAVVFYLNVLDGPHFDGWRATIQRPYVPAELIETASPEVLVGYVLDVDSSGQWTTIMSEGSRTILILDSVTIESRTVCVPDGAISKYKPRMNTFELESNGKDDSPNISCP